MMIPKVIQDPGEATAVSESKKTEIDGLREMQIKLYQGGGDASDIPTVNILPENEKE